MRASRILTLGCLLAITGCGLLDPEEEAKTPTFPKDGILDFVSVEGVAPGYSYRNDVIHALGQPEIENANSSNFYYYYPSQGLRVNLRASDSLVAAMYVYGSGWGYSVPRESDTASGSYTKYTGATSHGLTLNTSNFTMDSVTAWYGNPLAKGTLHGHTTTSTYPRYFSYAKDTLNMSFTMQFYFMGTDTTDFSRQPIVRIDLYHNTVK